jgi:hypothetical protein
MVQFFLPVFNASNWNRQRRKTASRMCAGNWAASISAFAHAFASGWLEMARMYWVRSKAMGAGQFYWLKLPLSCATDSYSCSTIHTTSSRSITLNCGMPQMDGGVGASVVARASCLSVAGKSAPPQSHPT